MNERQRQSLIPVRAKPWAVSGNGRIKLPAAWFELNGAAPTVHLYLTADGDLLVSSRDYTSRP